ncbi:MAG: endonuclease III [Methanobacteriota archaeon]|nr:MAG: endonuclease III [Euryarchaeota archaeon]
MTEIASRRLFAKYDTPQALARADVRDVQRRIKPVGFYRQKARKLREVSRVLLDRHGGKVPSTYEELIELPQVGPKTANCVLVYGYGLQALPIDTHCHRIPNRLGLIRTKTPEQTEKALARIIPREYWVNVNEWFVRFGKEVCKPIGPRCGECGFTSFCVYYRTRRKG